MLKWIDLPPVWLALFAAGAWALQPHLPGPELGPRADWIGGVFILGGIVLAGLAVIQMRRHRTTIIPHQTPSALVTTGVFRLSRNPIYLADAILLGGWILILGQPVALILIPFFALLIERRFIVPEEARLSAKFVAEFAAYTQQTNRWL